MGYERPLSMDIYRPECTLLDADELVGVKTLVF